MENCMDADSGWIQLGEKNGKKKPEYLSEYYFLWFITSARIVLSFNIKMKHSRGKKMA